MQTSFSYEHLEFFKKIGKRAELKKKKTFDFISLK